MSTTVSIDFETRSATDIKLGAERASQNSKSVALANGAAKLDYLAEYVATGAATAGDLSTSATYSIVYQ